MMELVLVAAAVFVAILAACTAIVFKLIVVVPPNRIAVLSGRKHTTPDGRTVGYRIVEGRQLRLPVIEMLDYLAELPPVISAEATGVYSSTGEAGPVAVTATVSYASGSARHHAVERFLGQPVDAVRQVIVQTLEGNVREVASTRTRDEVTRDTAKANDELRKSVAHDLKRLGLELISVTLGGNAVGVDSFADRMRETGLLDIATTTELACDVAGLHDPRLDDDMLAAAGRPTVAFANGRVTLRWSSAQVSPEQLLAGARALAAVRQEPRAYR